MSEQLRMFLRSVEEFDSRMAEVGADDMGNPTPCTEWSVRDLINHLVNEDRWVAPLLAGKTIAEVGDGNVKIVITGAEDGEQHITGNIANFLLSIGVTLPPQCAVTYLGDYTRATRSCTIARQSIAAIPTAATARAPA